MVNKKGAVINDEEENEDKEKAEAEDQLGFEAVDWLVSRLIRVMKFERNVVTILTKICWINEFRMFCWYDYLNI